MKNFYFTLLFLSLSFFVSAQATAPTGNSLEVGITEGQLSVSLTGGATYDIPISVPPGINGVVPQVGLTYNSQAGNGVAGYGWNISGVSTITRIPSDKFHDGVIDAVDFDNLDRFAFDGQRLVIKSGTSGVYGANLTEYETESFSNVKITSYGVNPSGSNFGPAYFKVEYPDGSKAYYGNSTDSRSITDWAIMYWENPQGVRISYSYILENNSMSIEYIKYGTVSTATPINQIKFVYLPRKRSEQAYIGGLSTIRNTILNEIQVTGNGAGFRNYKLLQEETSLGYERLKSITEKSADNLSYNPTVFNYKEPIIAEQTTFVNSIDLPLNSGHETTSGDFDGDGNLDFIQAGSKLYTNLNAGGSQPIRFDFSLPITGTLSTFKSLESDGKIMNRDAFCNMWYVPPTPNDGTIKGIKYDIYSIELNANKIEYSKEFVYPIQGSYNYYKYLSYSGDFNGDGLTDSMLFPMASSDNTRTFHKMFYLNLDRRIPDNFAKTSDFDVEDVQYFYLNNNPNYIPNAIAMPADVNGDGRTDLVVFRGSPTNKITVYSLDNNDSISILFETSYVFKTQTGLISSNGYAAIDGTNAVNADLNGDGKMDFVFPGIDKVVFMSTGTSFAIEALPSNFASNYSANDKCIPSDYNNDGKTDLMLITNTTTTTYYPMSIHYYSRLSSGNWTGRSDQYNSLMRNSTDDFYPIMIKPSKNFNDKPELLLLQKNNNGTTKICYFINQNHLANQKLLKDITTGSGVKETITYASIINGNGVYTASGQIENYPNIDIVNALGFQVVSNIEKQSASVYKKQLFAYYGAVSNTEGLGFFGFRSTVRTNWHNDSNTIISSISKFDIEQRGANVENYTVLGWHDPLISTGKYKPNNIVKSGAYTITGSENLVATQSIILKPDSWIKTGSTFTAKISPDANVSPNTPTDYITKSIVNYESGLLPNKVFKIKNVLSKHYSSLENTNSETITTYDDFNNPEHITVQLKEGDLVVQTTETTLDYDDQPYGATYYIGRPISKLQSVKVTGDTMDSEELYTYTNHLLTRIRKKGNNTDYIIEDNFYDSFGNIAKKTITVPAVAPNQAPAPRVTNYEYNPASPYNGRFLTKSIDIHGLATQYNYNPSSGVLDSMTNPYNLTTSYLYDSWFKKIQTKDYLGKKIIMSYTNMGGLFGIDTQIRKVGDDGSLQEIYYDDLGREVSIGNKNVSGTFYSKTEYDIYDRSVKVYEPFNDFLNYNNPNTLFSTASFDVYGRKTQSILYTGRTVTMNYSGLSSTVNDGSKTKTYKKNALGNVVSLKDDTPTTTGTITYAYFANGNLKSSDYDGVVTKITQDGWGRKTTLDDPSAGSYRYEYNLFGETTSETTPNGTTTYNLDDFGRLSTKIISGTNTNSKTTYNYDPTSKVLNSIVFEDFQANTTTNYTYLYDTSKRMYKTVEATPSFATFTKQLYFDSFGRVEVETSIASINGKSSTKIIKNTYKNGFPWQILDDVTQQVLWQTNTVNARGQLLTAQMGNGISITNTYDYFGYINQFKHDKAGTGPVNIMTINTTFDPLKGNLKSRSNSMFAWSEDFTNSYDSQDRLTSYKNAQGGIEYQSYDDRGKILEQNSLGTYNYNYPEKYRNSSVTLTPEAKIYYDAKPLQTVSYNVFKSPYEITEGSEKISFTYNDNNDRSIIYYGGEGLPISRRFRKHYSADGTMEIKEDRTLGTAEFITYIGGDAYTAPILVKSNGVTQNYLYLHRDYQGSILAITDVNATVQEKRLFDAWGSLISVQNGAGVALTGLTVLDRGYTGHEHLQSVGLVHMNGRLYDPKLHRFLQPDNNIQDPFNTQNYNRYSYVLNNPLKYSDPSGESVFEVLGYLFAAWVNGSYASGGELNPAKWNSNGWTNAFSSAGSVGASIGATRYVNGYMEKYNNSPELGVSAISGGNGGEEIHPYVSNEYSSSSKYNNEAFAYAGLATVGLVADDATVVGVVDDVLIPFAWGTAATVWTWDNRELIRNDAREIVDAIHRSFDPKGFHYVTYTKTSLDGSKVYVGRSSGYGTPEQIVAIRDANHHIQGYGAAILSSSLPATKPGGYRTRLLDSSYWSIRGSEQIQIERWRAKNMSGNSINGISPSNENMLKYIEWGLRLLF